ncbi:hypothetical protein N656DRAFT_535199 [Canariomyces notabilis]|uniref:Uncharacterized protein n=1 Tax=Canariomyces notabilis TaxID=2074819 RepID=A0AAN6THI2_9PEZI|nr:hypothetical protein N656DRAFT_535199 [Canariomyces arenarius]
MADRHATSSRALASGISKPRGTSTASQHSVRRNLFQSQLTRRPTASSSTTSAETLPLDTHHVQQKEHHPHPHQFHHLPLESGSGPSPQEDIVVRDKNGEIELGDPPTPPIDDAEELMALEARHDDEKERQRLADAVKQHQIGQNSVVVPAQPEELLDAVRASLRAKVAALAEDNWMFEREVLPHRH